MYTLYLCRIWIIKVSFPFTPPGSIIRLFNECMYTVKNNKKIIFLITIYVGTYVQHVYTKYICMYVCCNKKLKIWWNTLETYQKLKNKLINAPWHYNESEKILNEYLFLFLMRYPKAILNPYIYIYVGILCITFIYQIYL